MNRRCREETEAECVKSLKIRQKGPEMSYKERKHMI